MFRISSANVEIHSVKCEPTWATGEKFLKVSVFLGLGRVVIAANVLSVYEDVGHRRLFCHLDEMLEDFGAIF